MSKTILDGACKFCGQIMHVEVEANSSIEQITEIATMQCRCDEAVRYKMCQRGEKKINELFSERWPEVADIMIKAIPAVIDNQVAKLTIDTGENVKGIMQLKKGILNVKKETKINDESNIR